MHQKRLSLQLGLGVDVSFDSKKQFLQTDHSESRLRNGARLRETVNQKHHVLEETIVRRAFQKFSESSNLHNQPLAPEYSQPKVAQVYKSLTRCRTLPALADAPAVELPEAARTLSHVHGHSRSTRKLLPPMAAAAISASENGEENGTFMTALNEDAHSGGTQGHPLSQPAEVSNRCRKTSVVSQRSDPGRRQSAVGVTSDMKPSTKLGLLAIEEHDK